MAPSYGGGLRYLAFQLYFNQLENRNSADFRFSSACKNLATLKRIFSLNLPHFIYTGQERHSYYFLISN